MSCCMHTKRQGARRPSSATAGARFQQLTAPSASRWLGAAGTASSLLKLSFMRHACPLPLVSCRPLSSAPTIMSFEDFECQLQHAIIENSIAGVSAALAAGRSPGSLALPLAPLCRGLMTACLRGRAPIVGMLLAAGSDPNHMAAGPPPGPPAAVNVWRHEYPIHAAARHADAACVALLLAAGADPLARDGSGCTAAHCCSTQAARLLLEAAPQAALLRNNMGRTPMHHSSGEHLRLLLEAAPEAAVVQDNSGQVPLHFAAQGANHADSTDRVRLLLEAAPQAALMQDSKGRTPLHYARSERNEAEVRLLLAAAPEAALMRDHSGSLPLHYADWVGTIRPLLQAAPGAALMLDSRGLTPATAAIGRHSIEAAQCLLAEAPLQPTHEVEAALAAAIHSAGVSRLRQWDIMLVASILAARENVQLGSHDWYSPGVIVDRGLAVWLPAMLRHSDAAAARLMAFLPPVDRERLRTLALCLVRAERTLSVQLPPPITRRLLVEAAAQQSFESRPYLATNVFFYRRHEKTTLLIILGLICWVTTGLLIFHAVKFMRSG